MLEAVLIHKGDELRSNNNKNQNNIKKINNNNENKNEFFLILDFPVVSVGPENPYRVEVDHTAEMKCTGNIFRGFS